MQLIGTQGANPRKTMFVLKDSPERKQLIQDFYSNRAQVDPLVYKNWLMDLKAMLYNNN